MSALDALLNPVFEQTTKDVTLGNRLIDPETGKPAKFTLRTITQEERSAIRRRSMTSGGGDVAVNYVDSDLFSARCIVESCINPDLKSTAFCTFPPKEPGGKPIVVSPDVALKRRLLASEFERLVKAFMELNMMDEDEPADGEVSKN